MSAELSNSFSPDYVVVPGQHLASVLASKGMSQAELAVRISRPQKTINEIVKGKAAITPDTALQFERALGISAKTWNALEANYQLQLAEQRDRARLEDYATWAEQVPIAELRKRGHTLEANSKVDLVRQCLKFFGIDSPESLAGSSTVAAFRRSPAFEPDDLAVALGSGWVNLRRKALNVGLSIALNFVRSSMLFELSPASRTSNTLRTLYRTSAESAALLWFSHPSYGIRMSAEPLVGLPQTRR